MAETCQGCGRVAGQPHARGCSRGERPLVVPEDASRDPLLPTLLSETAEDSMEGYVGPARRRMPDDRRSITAKLEVGGWCCYVTAGMYEDGTLGEIFIKDAGKEGSTTQGLLDAFATMFSIGLQYGAEFDMLARKFAHLRFEPMGETNMPDAIARVNSPVDFIMRWLAVHFGSDELRADLANIYDELRRAAQLWSG